MGQPKLSSSDHLPLIEKNQLESKKKMIIFIFLLSDNFFKLSLISNLFEIILIDDVAASPTSVNINHAESIVCGPNSQPVKCPSCKRDVWTMVKNRASIYTHYFACMFCCFPHCVNSFQTQHQ